MSGCESFELLLAIRLDGPLVPAEEAQLRAHLEACSHCRALEHDLQCMREAFPTIAPQPPVDFTASILSQLPSRRHLPRRAWGGLAAVCALVLIGVGVAHPWQSTPQPGAGTLAARVLPSEPASAEDIETYEALEADIGAQPDSEADAAPSATAPPETGEASASSMETETQVIARAGTSAAPTPSPESTEEERAQSSDTALDEGSADTPYAGSGESGLALASPFSVDEDGEAPVGGVTTVIWYTAQDAGLLLTDYLAALTLPLDTACLTYLSSADDTYYFSLILPGGDTLYYTVTAQGGEIAQVDAPPI